MDDRSEKEEINELTKVLTHAVSHVGNEAIVLARYEAVQDETLARLWSGQDEKAVSTYMGKVEVHLGGPPEFYLLRDGEQPPIGDHYPHSILREAVDVFKRARKSTLRAHMFKTGCLLLRDHPEILAAPNESKVHTAVRTAAEEAFWEHAEAAYIRLGSFWDRIGQVLDFAFFNIRKFDQNGFSAVMDRIHSNAVPMNGKLKGCSSWLNLRAFQTSEKEDGLKWLLRRRNLIVHSVHLHPIEQEDEGMFKSQFNHLDIALRENLRPRDMQGEVDLLAKQLMIASTLFTDSMEIAKHSWQRPRVPPVPL